MEAVTEALLISKQLSGESFVLLKIGEKGIPKTMSAKKKKRKENPSVSKSVRTQNLNGYIVRVLLSNVLRK